MKAPNLPDKIYFSRLDVDSGYVYALSLENNGGSEYIHKDALLEWLENKVSISYGVATDTLVEVIDKLNSM